jgi:cytochrome c oxidase subunit 1
VGLLPLVGPFTRRLSALPQAIPGSGTGMTLWLVSMTLFIASSLMGGLNYVVTIMNLRTKGMKMTRMPLTIWAIFFSRPCWVSSRSRCC